MPSNNNGSSNGSANSSNNVKPKEQATRKASSSSKSSSKSKSNSDVKTNADSIKAFVNAEIMKLNKAIKANPKYKGIEIKIPGDYLKQYRARVLEYREKVQKGTLTKADYNTKIDALFSNKIKKTIVELYDEKIKEEAKSTKTKTAKKSTTKKITREEQAKINLKAALGNVSPKDNMLKGFLTKRKTKTNLTAKNYLAEIKKMEELTIAFTEAYVKRVGTQPDEKIVKAYLMAVKKAKGEGKSLTINEYMLKKGYGVTIEERRRVEAEGILQKAGIDYMSEPVSRGYCEALDNINKFKQTIDKAKTGYSSTGLLNALCEVPVKRKNKTAKNKLNLGSNQNDHLNLASDD